MTLQSSHLEAENKREREADPETQRIWMKSSHGRLEHPAFLLCRSVILPGYGISLSTVMHLDTMFVTDL